MAELVLLTLNGLPLPIEVAGEITQTYEPMGGFATLRMADGAGLRQSRWRKLRTQLSSSGWIPPALAGIDWDQPVEIGCIEPRGLIDTTNVFTLPAIRRTDLAVRGFSVADGCSTPARVEVEGDTATLAPAAGATHYAVYWYPLITALSDGPREQWDITGAVAGWEITAEEI